MRKKNSSERTPSRRDFLKKGLVTAAGIYIVPRHVLGGKGYRAPSDRLVVAAVGAGGKGESDIGFLSQTGKVDIAVLCDVDDRRSANTRKKFPSAKYYKDYREMLEKEHKHIDAVNVATPDHMHAIIGMAAMQLGKHVYIQKPLAHDIYEVRMLTEAAPRYKVVTQMGNQGASGDGVRQLIDWYRAGSHRGRDRSILFYQPSRMAAGYPMAGRQGRGTGRAGLESLARNGAL